MVFESLTQKPGKYEFSGLPGELLGSGQGELRGVVQGITEHSIFGQLHHSVGSRYIRRVHLHEVTLSSLIRLFRSSMPSEFRLCLFSSSNYYAFFISFRKGQPSLHVDSHVAGVSQGEETTCTSRAGL